MNEKSAPRRALTFWDHMAVLLRHRKVVIMYLGLIAVAAVSYALLTKQWYTSSAKLLPPPSEAFGLSNLIPSLASGALGAAGLASNETNLVISVLESRDLQDKVIDKFDWMTRHKFKNRFNAYESWPELVSWELDQYGFIVVSVAELNPELAAETVNFIVEFVRDKYNEISRAQARNQREFIERRLDQNRADLAAAEEAMKDFQSSSGVISLEDQLSVSVQTMGQIYQQLVMAQVELEVAQSTLPATASQVITTKKQVGALQLQLDALKTSQDKQSKDLLITLDAAPDEGMKYLRLMRDIELQQTILEFLLPQYEQARIMELREKSNIYVLDWGQVPDHRSKPRRVFLVLAWIFAGFMILYPILLFIEWLRRLEHEDPERHRFIMSNIALLQPRRFFARSSEPDRREPSGP